MELFFDSETTQKIILIAFGVVFLILAVIFCVWVGRELVNWYRLIEKEHRKPFFGIFGLGLLIPLASSNWAYALTFDGFLFSCWLTYKAYQRVIRQEPRKSDLTHLKKYLEREEEFDAMIANK